MKNQRKNHSILKVIFVVLGCVIIGIGVYGCKKEEPIREDNSSIEEVEGELTTIKADFH